MAAEPSKIVLGDETILDISQDTVNSSNLLQGETAHGSDGNRVVGSLVVTPIEDAQVAFIEAQIKTNIESGETVATLFGKIKKFFADLAADDVEYSSGVSVKDKIDDIDLTDGGTIGGSIVVNGNIGADVHNGTTSTVGNSYLICGNNIAEGTEGNSRGRLRLYSSSAYRADVVPPNNMTADRVITLPNVSDSNQTLALRSDVDYTALGTITPTTNEKWSSIIGKMRDTYFSTLLSKTNYCRLLANVDGQAGTVFQCGRVYSSATNTSWYSIRASATAIVAYVITTTGSAANLRKFAFNTSGLTITDMSDDVGSELRIVGHPAY